MTKKLMGLVVVLLAFLFLSGCCIRRCGPPCLGYGCPAWAERSDVAHAANTPTQPKGQALAKRNAPSAERPIAGK
jgi:hypothetical protein